MVFSVIPRSCPDSEYSEHLDISISTQRKKPDHSIYSGVFSDKAHEISCHIWNSW